MRPRLTIALFALLLASAAHAQSSAGWRGDGRGVYPDADPPLTWSTDKNVVWKTPLPSCSNASPVVAGDRIFVCAEPDVLLCIKATDGSILWQRNVKLSDTWTDDDRKLAEAKEKETDALKKKYKQLDDQVNEAFEARKKDPGNQELRKRQKDLQQEQQNVQKQISRNSRWALAQAESTNGYTSSTPVSDGKHVWVLLGSGVAACFDMNGERKWIQFVERPNHEYGHSASPVLADDKLLLFVRNLKAVNPLTGVLIWEVENARRGWGTPFVTRVGTTTVAVTAKGHVVRVADGKVLAEGIGYLEYASPIVVDGVAYHVEGTARATRLVQAEDGTVKAEEVWKATLKNLRYYASPVLLDGLIYAVNQQNGFYVIDAAKGEIVKSESLPLGKGEVFPSIVLAGKYLYVTIDNGTTIVMQPGRDWKVVATNKLDYLRSTPVFQGKRMYVRTWKHLYCIGE